jgi:hypothetical protein
MLKSLGRLNLMYHERLSYENKLKECWIITDVILKLLNDVEMCRQYFHLVVREIWLSL